TFQDRRPMSAFDSKRPFAFRPISGQTSHPSRRGCCSQWPRLASLGPNRPGRSEATIRRRALTLSAGALGLAWPLLTRAQSYPSKPITIVVPFSAGGPTDTIARVIGEGLREALGQMVIVDNVAGAAGTIGVGRVARASPDGYTISIGQWGS